MIQSKTCLHNMNYIKFLTEKTHLFLQNTNLPLNCIFICGYIYFLAAEKSAYTDLVDDFWRWRMQQVPEFATTVGLHDFDNKLETFTLEAFTHRKVCMCFNKTDYIQIPHSKSKVFRI